MNNLQSIITSSDGYKTSMFVQYPPGTEYVYSYIESRGGEYDKTVFFGLQAFIREYLTEPITMKQIDFAENVIGGMGCPFNRAGWEYILNRHAGYLPLEIKAVPEGTVMNLKNVLATVVNTDPECFWLTSYVETALLRAVWYGTTVASNSYHSKEIILAALEKSGSPEQIDFKLNDFGCRGAASTESAIIGGMAHLINFKGSDNIAAIAAAAEYYDADGPIGFSIPAMEHSTVTSWGKEHEIDSFKNMLNHYAKPGAIVAAVSDSYDIYAACHIWGSLKEQIVESGATIVIRPDSGNPSDVVPKCLQILEKYFGSVKNDKGYRVLNNVRMLWGDGINHSAISSILFCMQLAGYSADNIAFGQGGALLQGVNRDTLQFAMKCSSITVNGVKRDVFKDPVTDSGKRSKRGRMKLSVDYSSGFFFTIPESDMYYHAYIDKMELVYLDGTSLNELTFDQIRANSNILYNEDVDIDID